MDAPPPALTWLRRIRAVAERLAVAHFVGYPLAFLWAVAAIPLTIHLSIHEIDKLGGEMGLIGNFIVRRLAWPAAAAFVLAHFAAIPWIVAVDPKRGMRRSLFTLAGIGAVGAVFGGASWLWLMLR